MPLGNPQGYIDQGMPPEEAMMMAGPPPGLDPVMGPPPMDPMMGPPPGLPVGGPPGMPPLNQEDMMLQMLMGAVQGKWAGDEAQLAGEKGSLIQTLMGIAQAAPPAPQEMFAEGAPGNAGMPPMTDMNAPIG